MNAVAEPDVLIDTVLEMVARIERAPRANLVRTKAKAVARLGFGAERPTLDL